MIAPIFKFQTRYKSKWEVTLSLLLQVFDSSGPRQSHRLCEKHRLAEKGLVSVLVRVTPTVLLPHNNKDRKDLRNEVWLPG